MEPNLSTSSWRKFVILLGIIMIVGVVGGLVIQQSRSAASQGLAWHVSEAGVNYVLHLLNAGICTPAELAAEQPIVQAVPGATESEQLGIFAVRVEERGGAGRLKLTATGGDGGAMGSCQKIGADVESFSGVLGTKYRVLSWHNQGKKRCGNLSQPSPVVCKGLAQ